MIAPRATRLFGHALTAMFFGACIVPPLGCACGGDSDPRPAVLGHIARAVAVPAFAAFATRAHDTVAAVDALCDQLGPGSLELARAAWTAERDAWARTLPLGFGPLEAETSALDYWPVRTDTIDVAIADLKGPSAAAAHLATLGISARGMPALEYLLWGDMPGTVLADMDDETHGAARCAYARALAADIATRADLVHAAWTGDHADALARAGQPGLDQLLNHQIDAIATMVKTKLDTPLGNLTGAAVDPTLVESRFSGRGQADLQANLDGVWAVYHGADLDAPAAGLAVLVADLDPALDDRVRAQHARARDVLAQIPGPLGGALFTDRQAVQLARDELDALRRILKLDVASLLGVTLALSDNDGD